MKFWNVRYFHSNVPGPGGDSKVEIFVCVTVCASSIQSALMRADAVMNTWKIAYFESYSVEEAEAPADEKTDDKIVSKTIVS